MIWGRREQEKGEAVKRLRKYVRPGSTVYIVLRSVSRSGMSRRIDFYMIQKNKPLGLTDDMGKARTGKGGSGQATTQVRSAGEYGVHRLAQRLPVRHESAD